MDYQQAQAYCLSRPEAVVEYPFGPQAAVFKVKGKMFGLLATCGDSGKELGTVLRQLRLYQPEVRPR